MLFEFEYDPITLKKINGIGWHMIQQVICNADKISKLTNPQIDYIIEQVKSKTITDQSHVGEISESVATTLAHDFNSSGNYKEEDWFDEDAFFNEANLSK